MSEQAQSYTPLLYTNVAPVDTKKHAANTIDQALNLSFSAKTHAVPVNLIELPQLCHHYPVVFSPDAGATPIAILGLTEGENLFVNNDGQWNEAGTYVPSYIRRYPFLFAEITGTDQLTLCVDEIPGVISTEGPMKLFEPDGKPTVLTNTAMEFCKSFHAATLQTREFCAALEASGILVEREAEIPLPNGRTIRFGAFRVIDEAKWAKLDDKTFLDWRNKGWLPGIYAAQFSGASWINLARLHMARHGSDAA